MEKEKYIDESWKESASREKEDLAQMTTQSHPSDGGASASQDSKKKAQETQTDRQGKTERSHPPHAEDIATEQSDPVEQSAEVEIDFLNYVTSLGFQTMIFLGEIPHPVTNEVEKNLEQAKFLIDTLVMLREKTKGNLTKQEIDLLNSSIYQLQMKYVEISQI